jgi:hypothetical protein
LASIGASWKLFRDAHELRGYFRDNTLTSTFLQCSSEPLPPSSTPSPAAMPPMRRPHPPRSPPSSSSESAVSKRRAPSPRLAAFSPSGTRQIDKVKRGPHTYNVISDGIARVHGMANVQAEELVE